MNKKQIEFASSIIQLGIIILLPMFGVCALLVHEDKKKDRMR